LCGAVVLVWRESQRPGEPELPAVSVVGSGIAVGSAALGVGLLRASWLRRGGGRPWLSVAGWVAFVCGAGAWRGAGLGWDEAIALAMLAPSLMAYLVLARQAQWRPTAAGARRARRAAQTPGMTRAEMGLRAESDAGGALARGAARALLAGPVALGAALGLTGLLALRAPGTQADRVVAAGFMLPVAWAVGAIWATMDRKLTRVA